MMLEPTLEKLRTLKMFAMVNAWIAQRNDTSSNDLDFDSRFALLIEAESLARDNKRMHKLLHDAKLRIPSACIEDVDFGSKRELDRALVRQLATGRWIAERQNVIVTGALISTASTGLGAAVGGTALVGAAGAAVGPAVGAGAPQAETRPASMVTTSRRPSHLVFFIALISFPMPLMVS